MLVGWRLWKCYFQARSKFHFPRFHMLSTVPSQDVSGSTTIHTLQLSDTNSSYLPIVCSRPLLMYIHPIWSSFLLLLIFAASSIEHMMPCFNLITNTRLSSFEKVWWNKNGLSVNRLTPRWAQSNQYHRTIVFELRSVFNKGNYIQSIITDC